MRRKLICAAAVGLLGCGAAKAANSPAGTEPHRPIPVCFTLAEPGFVTLVVEDATGQRVRNLVSHTSFPGGPNAVW